ncbi:MFS transporter [Pluralibacter sp.]|uniref:MFS transporter n=1 Tax=Pluralibacter sp. TaxID=1920032 RepID=UPI0025CB8616|nr:MFS transporter [Pluralibacter sp.]MBV8043987.1 MFS transporter [Pluralibacter sp.]
MKKQSNFYSMCILNATFFIWGVITALTAVSVPYIKQHYSLTNTSSSFISLIFFCVPLLASIPIGRVITTFGYKGALKSAYWLAILGSGIIILAYQAHSFPMLCAGVSLIALAVVAMQVVANPYLAALGTASSVSGRLSLASSINSFGTVVAPLSAALILGGFYQLSVQEQSMKLTLIYGMLLVFVTGLIFLVHVIKLPDVEIAKEHKSNFLEDIKELFGNKLFTLSVLGIFCYVGAEVSVAVNTVIYLTESTLGNLSIKSASSLISLYWAGAMIGRLLYGCVANKIRLTKLMTVCTIMPSIIILIVILWSSRQSGYLLLFIGLTNSVIYPAIYALVINNTIAKLTPIASAVLIMAGFGGAIIPSIQALASDNFGVAYGFLIPLLSYLYLFYYTLRQRRFF